MRLHPQIEKNSKRVGLVCLASALLCQCVDFAPDGAQGAGGRDAGGESGASPAAPAGDAGGAAASGASGSAGQAAGGEGGVVPSGDSGSAGQAAGGEGGVAPSGDSGSSGRAGAGELEAAGVDGSGELTAIRPERSVIETNPDALVHFNLQRVLESVTGDTGSDVYRAYVLSFTERTEAYPGPRCDDEQPSSDGFSSLNGFPLPCPADAANLDGQLLAWKPLALTNRFDLAPVGGENCGEQHLSFFFNIGLTDQPNVPVRAFLRFAAVVENPAPERGLEGCRPLLDFWASLSRSEYDAPERRASAFELAFLGESLPPSSTPTARELAALQSGGFQSLIGSGFRHNGRVQLLYLGKDGQWHFFEDALVLGKQGFIERFPLTQSLAVAALLNEHPKRELCIRELLASIPSLVNEDRNLMRLDVNPACFAATSSTGDVTLTDGLSSAPLGPQLRTRFDAHLKQYYPSLVMSGAELSERAQFAGTCAGCHVLGDSALANPSSYSHVDSNLMQACASTGPDLTRRCYARSPLLKTIFIPHWTNVLEDFLQHPGAYGPLPSGMPSTRAIDGAALTAHHR